MLRCHADMSVSCGHAARMGDRPSTLEMMGIGKCFYVYSYTNPYAYIN